MPATYLLNKQYEYKQRVKRMLRAKMAELDIKQKDIAYYLGIDESTVSRMLSKGSLSVIQLIQLDELFHFEESDFAILFNQRVQKRRNAT